MVNTEGGRQNGWMASKVLGGKPTSENKVCGVQYVCVSVAFLLCVHLWRCICHLVLVDFTWVAWNCVCMLAGEAVSWLTDPSFTLLPWKLTALSISQYDFYLKRPTQWRSTTYFVNVLGQHPVVLHYFLWRGWGLFPPCAAYLFCFGLIQRLN